MMSSVCRVCLACDIRLHSIINTPLQAVFEKILNISMVPKTYSMIQLCYLCIALLNKFEKFIQKCIRSHEVLQQLLNNIELSDSLSSVSIDRKLLHLTYNLEVEHTLQDFFIPNGNNKLTHSNDLNKNKVDVKNEYNLNEEKLKVEESREDDYKDILSPSQCQDKEEIKDFDTSESEDDIPLKNIAKSTSLLLERCNRVRKKKERVKTSAQIIILSKKEQLAEVTERSKSTNYLESPYKCDFCYKGFINMKAYQLHMAKHDKSSGPFLCEICQLRYKTERQLRAHITTSHSHIYKCGLCAYRSHTTHQAKEHDNWHKGHKFECKLCSKQFMKSSSYLTHMRTGHPSQYTCDLCGAKAVSHHGLAMHRSKVHSGNKGKSEGSDRSENTSCNVCGLEVSLHTLKAHLETHDDNSSSLSYNCTKCGNSFKSRKSLRLHNRRMHLGIKYNKNVVCEVCGKKFPSNAALKYHQRTHTGEKPYSCSVCSKNFACKNRLRTHTRVHNGERPYNCSQCNAKFAQKPALNRHFRVHTGVKPYICHVCSKSFTQSNSLKLHVRTVHLKMPSKYKKNKTKNGETLNEKVEGVDSLQSLVTKYEVSETAMKVSLVGTQA